MERSSFRGLTGWDLKVIAAVTMLIDHIGAIFFSKIMIFRIIGRLSFPIFCFLVAEGFCYTRDLKRYLGRMFLFALITEVPFDLAFFGKIFYPGHQNVLFTLFFGLLFLWIYREPLDWYLKYPVLALIILIAVAFHTDYSWFGIALIWIFYRFREEGATKLILAAVSNLCNGSVQIFGALAMILIAFYNGEAGRRIKYFFYLFYPGHLVVLAMFKQLYF